MISAASTRIVAVLLLCSASALAVETAKDPIKDAGLIAAGGFYVLPEESAVLEKMKALRATKVQADKETRARAMIDIRIKAQQKIIHDSEKQWHELENRLPQITRTDYHNNVIRSMNKLVADAKNAEANEKEAEEQAGKCSISAKTQFVDDMIALKPQADAVANKYADLANDTALKSAIDQANTAADPKLALGPSTQFVAAMADLKKWDAEVQSETIPLHEKGGIRMVDVLVNGQQLTMGLDTGAAMVTITGEVAEKLNIVPNEKSEVLQLQLADGHTIEGKEMTLKSVRVGRFTVEDVKCAVLQKGLTDAPLLLGGSFLNHFIVKIDSSTDQLHLTEIKGPGAGSASPRVSALEK